jgi:hypothetical protein
MALAKPEVNNQLNVPLDIRYESGGLNRSRDRVLVAPISRADIIPESFDHLVGGREKLRRHDRAELLGRHLIDAQLDSCDLLHWQSDRAIGLFAIQDATGVNSGLPPAHSVTPAVSCRDSSPDTMMRLACRTDMGCVQSRVAQMVLRKRSASITLACHSN